MGSGESCKSLRTSEILARLSRFGETFGAMPLREIRSLSELELPDETTFRQLGRSSEIDVLEAGRSCSVECEPSEDAGVLSIARSLLTNDSTSEATGLSDGLL